MIVVDAGPLVAMWMPSDVHHARIREFLRDNREELVLPVHVVTEVAYFLGTRATSRIESRFLAAIGRGQFSLECAIPSDFARAANLVERYADFPLGTVDALIAAMAERLDVTTLLTLDRRHFGAIRPAHCESFTLLP